jgi:uncharacterized protein
LPQASDLPVGRPAGTRPDSPREPIRSTIEPSPALPKVVTIETLRRSEAALRARGVRRAALFGSLARGDDRPGSDIDIMVEIDPAARITVFDYVDLKEYIAGLFDGPVDVVSRDNLKPYVRPAATADAIYAF